MKVYLGNYRLLDVLGGIKVIPISICCDTRISVLSELSNISVDKEFDKLAEMVPRVVSMLCSGISEERARELVDAETIDSVIFNRIVSGAVSSEFDGEIEKREDSIEMEIRPLGFGARSKRIVEISNFLKELSTDVPADIVVEFLSLSSGLSEDVIRPYVERGYASIDTIASTVKALSSEMSEDAKKN